MFYNFCMFIMFGSFFFGFGVGVFFKFCVVKREEEVVYVNMCFFDCEIVGCINEFGIFFMV